LFLSLRIALSKYEDALCMTPETIAGMQLLQFHVLLYWVLVGGTVLCDIQGTTPTEQEHLHLLDRGFGRPQGLFGVF